MIATVQTAPFHVFGYASRSTLKQVLSIEAQKAKIDQYFAVRFGDEPLATFAGCYEDTAISSYVYPLRERPHGLELNLKLRHGDHVIAALGDRIFHDIADCAVCIKDWTERGIIVHYANHLGMDTSTAQGRFAANIIGSMGEHHVSLPSLRVRERNNIARAHGLPTNGNCRWGWKIIGTKQTRRFVEALSDRNVANMALHHVDTLRWTHKRVVEAFNDSPPAKARHYGRGRPWTEWGVFQAVRAARAKFEPDPRVAR